MSLTLLASEILAAAKEIDKSLNESDKEQTQPSSNASSPTVFEKISKCSFDIVCVIGNLIFRPWRLILGESTVNHQSLLHTSSKVLGKDDERSVSYFERYNALPSELLSKCEVLINNCHRIRTLIEAPETALVNIYSNVLMILKWTEMVSLQVICHFELFKAIPPSGSATYSEISAATGLPLHLVIRFIRIAILNGIFTELVPGQVSHTPRSHWLLSRGQGLIDIINVNCYELAPAALRYPEAIEKYGVAEEPEQSPFALINSNMPIFHVFAREESRRLRFGNAMQYLTSDESYDVRHILVGHDWISDDKAGARVLDVGGGLGHVSVFLAEQTKYLNFTVQDLPNVVEDAIKNKATLIKSQVQDRISFLPLSFFTPHPVSDIFYDVVFMRWILHNWSDKHVRQIFRSLLPILRKGSRVLIIEYLLDEECIGVNATHNIGLRCDLMMGVGFGAKERTAREIRALMEDVAAECNGVWSNWSVRKPKCSTMGFLEATWQGV
ncbi:sterigmatocystin 8-O-methyltransferase [Blumeria hordei DH14]|uniref:Sterigmatocystin 8-O-methyltransferase n=1 Tax=Blumeria graminis f. sp. hordei (strain DH14) TaxID=546991 RepID=N1JGZ8_BLUG1|nr:sterigmatocystin 8-O-methyltransferase [Blumeria hordei DH14]